MSVLCKKPPFANNVFIDNQNFKNNSEKGHSRNISTKIILKSDQRNLS